MKDSRAPLIIAIVLLLLPVYVAIYLALVIPGGEIIVPRGVQLPFPHAGVTRKYKLGGYVSEFIFWPLEQIDRQLRPEKWEVHWELWGGYGSRQIRRDDP